MKSIFGSSAIVVTAILLGSLIFSAKSSVAETASPQDPATRSKHETNIAVDTSNTSTPANADSSQAVPVGITAAVPYVATAYSLRGRTASGRYVARGIIAADPRILPLGSRVHLHAGPYTGEYLVADTGGLVRGKRIDIWTPSTREAMRFGRRTVKLTVLSYGPKRSGRTARATR
jgi:3D (Asp-Asp-Asp) domain-containing protein